MSIYYNEFNPESAAILRELMKENIIPYGDVDERSIIEVNQDEIRNYTQCHFFAGIGGWPIALRLAGWPDDRPVWTGSCPCQPFSSAGKQKGKTDERHLFPIWLGLIAECRPATIFAEQVSSAIAHGWLDDVYQGLETEGYAVGAAVLPACSVGSPHRRDRLFFVANSTSSGFLREEQQKDDNTSYAEISSNDSDSSSEGISHFSTGKWSSCADGKSRFFDSRISMLANGVQHKKPILHGFGNAIVPQVAAAFIKATT